MMRFTLALIVALVAVAFAAPSPDPNCRGVATCKRQVIPPVVPDIDVAA